MINFIDVGANVGYIASYGAALVGNSGEVHAFEPVPRYFERLESVSADHPHFMAIQAACGDTEGKFDRVKSQFSHLCC